MAEDGTAVVIDLIEYEHGLLRLEGSLAGIALPQTFTAQLGGEPIPVTYKSAASFSLTLSESELEEKTGKDPVSLDFHFRPDAAALPLRALEYQARLTGVLKASYWCFDAYMLSWRDPAAVPGGIRTDGIIIRKAPNSVRFLQELRFLLEMLTSASGSRKMFALRILYWIARPVYNRKTIWITFDKLYKGGDNGEYFFKYMTDCCRRRPELKITPVYVLRRDAADYERLKKEGYHPLAYRSVHQRLSYLYASMVFGTHSGVPSFCGLNKWEIQFLQDRLQAVNCCIQHGLSVQNLTADSGRLVNNNKLYYCASPSEVKNLLQPAYEYAPENLRLTGLPRFDGLIDRSSEKKQILIAPTWRKEAASASSMGEQRAYNPDFRDSSYYRVFQDLLTDERLNQAAMEAGFHILFLVHPVFAAQKEDFLPGAAVQVLTPLEISYEQALTESSLMVTDYSGVQFDFAYMRKPLVYYHPDALPPQYESDGFSYEEQGFGEILTTQDALVSCLCAYLKEGCVQKEIYRAREERFFAYDDHENCRRIFEDALSFRR